MGKKSRIIENSGNYEWYSPPEYVEAARVTMGSIDLDPASCKNANEVIQANHIYTKETNGLIQPWFGNIWLNPPYSHPEIQQFTETIVEKFKNREFQQATMLVNNATETKWFQLLLHKASCFCLIKGRVSFYDERWVICDRPLQGQAVFYFGSKQESFIYRFDRFGKAMWL